MAEKIKIRLDEWNIFPDYVEESNPDFGICYEMPKKLWEDYNEARNKYLELRKKIQDIKEKQNSF